MGNMLRVRLRHDGLQPGTPLDEPLHFGLQDKNGQVHSGSGAFGSVRQFDLTLEVKTSDTERPVFGGPFVHGPPTGRFLYLSWKREGEHAAPWGWRIKIPLSDIGWPDVHAAEEQGKCLAADVMGRRPHASEPVFWLPEPVQSLGHTQDA